MYTRTALALLAALWTTAPAAQADEACTLRLEAGERHAWTITAGGGAIRGDKTRLTVEAEAIYGFLFGEQTRLKVAPDRITGRLAGKRADLHVERSAEHLLLRGPVGGVRTLVRVTDAILELTAQELQVGLAREASEPGAPVTYSDATRSVRLILSGCPPTALLRRPGLMAVVNWLVHNPDQVLPIAPTTGMRQGRESGSTPVQSAPPPPTGRPRPPRP